eukprot:758341-Hanusia_phi.AAC.3
MKETLCSGPPLKRDESCFVPNIIQAFNALQGKLPRGRRGIVSFLQGLSNRMQGKKLIGEDQHGNKFWEISNPGGIPNPKREVEFVSKDMVQAPWPVPLLPDVGVNR